MRESCQFLSCQSLLFSSLNATSSREDLIQLNLLCISKLSWSKTIYNTILGFLKCFFNFKIFLSIKYFKFFHNKNNKQVRNSSSRYIFSFLIICGGSSPDICHCLS